MSTPTGKPRKQIILGAYLGGVNHHTLWHLPESGSQIDFSTFERTARTAERGRFDFFFLAEGLALRERDGQVFDQDIVGRPDTFTVLASIAAVTEHLGLAATINATFNEPYELARQIASLDHLSGGRAAWNVVTSFDAFTGGNFRRGGFLDRSQRYERAAETIEVVRSLWDSWAADDLVIDKEAGVFSRSGAGSFAHTGEQFDVGGWFGVPRSPQGHPVILQAGVSPQGRDFAAASSDAIFSPYGRFDEARDYYQDVKARAAGFGRDPNHLKILPSASFVLGATEAEAQEKARWVREEQVTGRTAQILLEQIWNRDLSAYDPDGPLPDVEPALDAPSFIAGRALTHADRPATVARLRAQAEANGWSLRQTVIEEFTRGSFVGTPTQVADALDDFVQNDGSDGFVIGSHLVPTGLDELVDDVVPLLQERGSLRTEYEGTTLRDNLGLPAPACAGATVEAARA
ncbi:NtaA/DmoA family FMN-dependent monooxygenase [Promicromonospora sp. MEB111]|uniref:NtaA/DmoA family FMN-dependent monooxygenase n=1 Tax=Promicromonospora sp. MEB111 TaxID=3040301 RepID=UPI00254D87F2|nr:NtaA/DmoA family FMN-dependent monooxygenase [Promicromonospora sp. MEB111]